MLNAPANLNNLENTNGTAENGSAKENTSILKSKMVE